MIFFYSWQSDHSTTRWFIKECLENAVVDLNEKVEMIESERESESIGRVTLDHDTKGVPGIPEVAATIFSKIESCDVFVADVSFVGKGAGRKGRLLPNPNVLIELGYAIANLGQERIVLLLDTRYGSPERIPFDLAHRRRPVTFSTRDDIDKKAEKKRLTKELVQILAVYRERRPAVKVDLSIVLSYEQSDFNSKTSQRAFNIDVFGINKGETAIANYELFVECQRDIVLPHSQSGEEDSQRSTSKRIVLKYPISQKNPLPTLYPDKLVKIASIRGLVTDRVLPNRAEVQRSTLDVELYSLENQRQEKSFRVSRIDPFRLMDIQYGSLLPNRTYKLHETDLSER